MQRIYALCLLAWSLLRSFFAYRLQSKPGIVLFREKYGPDRLPHVTKEERALFSTLSGCIACGLCDIGEGVAIARSKGQYAGAMDLVLSGSRNMPDFDATILSLAHVSEERLAAIEDMCPGHVPVLALTRFVKKKADDARTMSLSSPPALTQSG